MNLELEGQMVLVTGSSHGIGKGIARAFLNEGAHAILTGRNEITLNDTSNLFKAEFGSERVFSFCGDLNDVATVERLYDHIQEKMEKLDHLVCNIGRGRSVPPLQEDMEEFQRMLDINLLNSVNISHEMLPLLEKSASSKKAVTSITFISSICAIESMSCPIAYAASKSALITYAKNIARPLGQKGVRVNVVTPGNILFPGSVWEDKMDQDKQRVMSMLEKDVPLQRFGTIDDVAHIVVFLASGKAGFVTGANWVVDGGQSRS